MCKSVSLRELSWASIPNPKPPITAFHLFLDWESTQLTSAQLKYCVELYNRNTETVSRDWMQGLYSLLHAECLLQGSTSPGWCLPKSHCKAPVPLTLRGAVQGFVQTRHQGVKLQQPLAFRIKAVQTSFTVVERSGFWCFNIIPLSVTL